MSQLSQDVFVIFQLLYTIIDSVWLFRDPETDPEPYPDPTTRHNSLDP